MKNFDELLAEVDELTASRSVLTEENAALKAQVEELSGKAKAGEEAQAKVVELTEALGAAEKSIAENAEVLQASANEINELKQSQSDFDAKVAAEVSRLGLRDEPAPTPKPAMSADEIREQFASMTAGAERSAFFAKHKEVLGLRAK